MDKDQARFILRSFRPDGADVDDRDFAEALALAARDRELGEWLAAERSFDASFASALDSVRLPDSLREDILGCLAGARNGVPEAEDAIDAAWVGAFATIRPPRTLRDEIVAAMERTALASPPAVTRLPWRRLAVPIAAAAGVALAFFVTSDREDRRTAERKPVHVDVVQAGFIHTFESPLFSLDQTWEDDEKLVESLKSRKLPCPGCLPPGLVGVKSISCRELVVDGKKGFMVCFDESTTGGVHMVIFRREDVSGALPQREHPAFSRKGSWSAARWEDDKHVFILIGATDLDKLAALF